VCQTAPHITQHGLCAHQLCINMCSSLCNTSLRFSLLLSSHPLPSSSPFGKCKAVWQYIRIDLPAQQGPPPLCQAVDIVSNAPGVMAPRPFRSKASQPSKLQGSGRVVTPATPSSPHLVFEFHQRTLRGRFSDIEEYVSVTGTLLEPV